MASRAPVQQAIKKTPPWTVYVLVGWAVVGLVWSLVSDDDRSLFDVATAVVSLGFAYYMWAGKAWTFTLMFMLTSLCAAGLIVVILLQAFLFEMGVHPGLLWGVAGSGLSIFLLVHPATKDFAGLRNN